MNFGFLDCGESEDLTIDDVLKRNSNEIMLEPRLQEYLNKKQHNRIYNQHETIPLEKQYSITATDQQVIRSYLSGDKNTYNRPNLDQVESIKTNFLDTKNDPRLMKLQKKLEKNNKATKARYNYNNTNFNQVHITDEIPQIIEEDKIFQERDSGMYNNHTQNSQSQNNMFLDNNFNEYQNSTNYRPKAQLRQHVPVKLNYKERLPNKSVCTTQSCMTHEAKVQGTINKLNSYVNHTNTIYNGNSEFDREKAIGKGGDCKRHTKYQPVPYRGIKAGLRDDITLPESERTLGSSSKEDYECGYTTHGFKSYGYANPSEHYFDYVNPDFQTADHTVLPFPRGGIDTRALNHKKVHKRELYN